MTSDYNNRIAASKARLDIELRNFAKRMSHHKPADFVEMVRQRFNVPVTEDYAKELLGKV